jgi:outer membrane usher protein FimD/PapC
MGRSRQSTPLLGAMAAAWLAAGVSAPVGAADLAAPGADAGIDIAALAPPESPPTLLPAPDTVHLHVLEVTVNALPVGTWEVLERDGGYWVTAEALQAWRVLLPAAARPQMNRQRLWWPLFAVPGYRAQFDAARQTLELEVLAEALAPRARHRLRAWRSPRPCRRPS